MSDENHLFPSRFEASDENVALAIEHAKRSTPELKWGACEHEPGEIERLIAKEPGPCWMAWTGPKDSALYAAIAGNGPTSEVNALFFAHARDIVISVGEDWQRYRKALQSIADSTCCEGCNEAKAVAAAALKGSAAGAGRDSK